ncbi:hypothetical protein [Aeromicrobium fastidiosum]|uniref:Uncharacterized protein n=1 Tax=Aeromicrobium fastidiosum TaxID=52699 RepID=A0A641AQC9_9ACTN|nr:hypothetical protein [Aeromicrobium fastidiosum]KAA1378302.1 hypothetical protein ESP62_007965 [Aeromicrobium fastidiosum]MBP2388878.1 endogenous inhibitor of DNA gyrase (YacG/DUF329 family) [Aeromicrobium fastidiosum]
MTMTRDEAAAKARQVLAADDVTPHVDPELEGDTLCGGFAFVAGDSGAVIGYRGGYQTSVLALSGETIETLVIGWLAEQRHQYGVDAAPAAPERPTHPCPICGRAVVHQDRYPAAVCPECQQRAADRDGRRIVGYNEGWSGGFIALYAESPTGPQTEMAGEVLETGRCWIDGIECTIGEARFGGVVVQRAD